MNRMRLPGPGIVSLAFFLASAQAATAQGQTGTIPYARLHSLQTAFAGIPQADRDKLRLDVLIRHDAATNHAPIGLWVEQGGRRIPIPVSAAGALDLPSRDDWATQGLLVHTDQPKGSLTVSIGLSILPPAGQTVPVGYLLAGMAQAQGALRAGYRQLGGLMGALAVPGLRVVRAKLASCCGGTARLQGRPDALPRQDADGVIVIPLAFLNAHPADTLAFSARVQSLDADEK
jgi:hypothetical protein